MPTSRPTPLGLSLSAVPRRVTPVPIAPTRQPTPLPSRVTPMPTYIPLADRRAVAAKKAEHHDGGLTGMLKGAVGAVTGLPAGVGHLVAQAAKSAYAPVQAGLDVVRGRESPTALMQLGTGNAMQAELTHALDRPNDRTGLVAKYEPLQLDFAQSMQRTGGRALHPSRYRTAFNNGSLVNAILEDTANASIVAGPLGTTFGEGAKAASIAGHTGLASALETAEKGATFVHTAGARVAAAPFAPLSFLRKGINFARTRGVAGLEALAEMTPEDVLANPGPGQGARLFAANHLADRAQNFRDHAPLVTDKIGTALRTAVQRADEAMPRSATRAKTNFIEGAGMHDAIPPSVTEQGTAMALLNSSADVDQMLRAAAEPKFRTNPITGALEQASGLTQAQLGDLRGTGDARIGGGLLRGQQGPLAPLSAEELRRVHTTQDIPEQTFTPDVHQAAMDYQAGNLPIDVNQRIERYAKGVTDVSSDLQQKALDNHGRLKGGLNPEQLGDDAIEPFVLDNLHQLGMKGAELDMVRDAIANGYKFTDLEGLPDIGPLVTKALDNPMSYPKNWRRTMGQALRGRAAGLDVPVRPNDLLDAGVRKPIYMSSKPSDLISPIRNTIGRERANLGTEGFKGISSEQMGSVSEIHPYSARTVAEAFGREAGKTAYNARLAAGIAKAGLGSVGTVIDAPVLADMVKTLRDDASTMNLTETQTRAHIGRAIVEKLGQEGWSVIEGDLTDPKPGTFNPDSGMRYEDIGPQTIVLPTNVKAKLVQYFNERGGKMPARVIDYGNKKFKGNVLPFSARWQVGDMVGGPFMAWVGGGINPLDMFRAMRSLKDLDPLARERLFQHENFADVSLSQGDRMVIDTSADAPVKSWKTHPYGNFKKASFRFNNTINELNRHSYLLAKTNELLRQEGLSSVEDMGGRAGQWASPKVKAILDTAVEDAMKVMGSFDQMSPFEQRVLKRAFPFYAWNRHITMLAFRTAIDNPVRIMWTMRLGAYGTNKDDGTLPSYLRGALGFGEKILPLNSINPFNDVVGGRPIWTPSGAVASLTPAVKLGAAALFGVDLARGTQQLTRPSGTGNKDEYGRAADTPLWRHPGELAYQALKILPQSRIGLSLLPDGRLPLTHIGTGPHPRYGTGETIIDKSTNRPIDTTSRWTAAAGLVGLPMPVSRADAQRQLSGLPTSKGKSVNLKGKRSSTNSKKVHL